MHASAAAAAVAGARNGVPLVITEHSEASWRDERAWRTSRSAYRRAAHVIAVSGSIGRRLTVVNRVSARRMTAIRNAILLLPGHEAMVREAVYTKVYPEALRHRPRYVGALAQSWLAR